MPDFEAFDIVAVRFPYTDRAIFQRRPALVVVPPSRLGNVGIAWVMMITAAENRRWVHDIEIRNLAEAGLPIPSIIRPAKIAAVEVRDIEKLGALSRRQHGAVRKAIARFLP
jgi:mRNA interferase MazF